jgi:transposase InsO family protein
VSETYSFVEAEKAEGGNVVKARQLLEVSRSAFYAWHHHQPTARTLADAELAEAIHAIYDESRQTYGWPRVHAELRRQGMHVGKNRVARIMRQKGLIGRCRRRSVRTTIPDPEAKALDLVKRIFGPGTVEVDRIWAGDITFVRTWEGWLYVATVIDLASRKVVGWAMADHMRADLVCDALRLALGTRRPAPGLIFHSDRGTQYTATEFTELLAANRIIQSLSRPRQCWDNAVVESWFATLKMELTDRHPWPTRARVRQAIVEFIEVFYNRKRLHSSLNYMTPVAYEAIITEHHKAAHAA